GGYHSPAHTPHPAGLPCRRRTCLGGDQPLLRQLPGETSQREVLPRLRHDCRSVEYNATESTRGPIGRCLALMDGCGIGWAKLIGIGTGSWRTSRWRGSRKCGSCAKPRAPTPASSSRSSGAPPWLAEPSMCWLQPGSVSIRVCGRCPRPHGLTLEAL